MRQIIYSLLVVFIGTEFSQNNSDNIIEGEIDYFLQKEGYRYFTTKIDEENYNLYVTNTDDSIYFQKHLEQKPRDIIICEKPKKILICFTAPRTDEDYENFAYKLYNLYTGKEVNFPKIDSKLTKTIDGNFLYATANCWPLDIYNLNTNEYFEIRLPHWTKVASMSGERLVILQRRSEKNEEAQRFAIERDKRRKDFVEEIQKQERRYMQGKIPQYRYQEIRDSLKQVFNDQSNRYTGSRIVQTGTWMWIYDLNIKEYIFNTEIKDQEGNIIILDRDEDNRHTLNIDSEDYIHIYGTRRSENFRNGGEKMYLKYDSNFNLVWAKSIEK